MICSLESKLFFIFICSIRIRSRKWDIVEKPLQHISNPYNLDVGEAEVEIEEADEAPVEADAEVVEDLLDDEEDEGTGAKDVDIHAYFPEAQISAGKVAEVLVSVRVSTLHLILNKFIHFNSKI